MDCVFGVPLPCRNEFLYLFVHFSISHLKSELDLAGGSDFIPIINKAFAPDKGDIVALAGALVASPDQRGNGRVIGFG